MRRAWSFRKYLPCSANASRRHAHTTTTSHLVIYWWSSCGTSISGHQSAILCYCIVWSCLGSSRQMPLIPADTTYFDKAVTFTELVRQQGADRADFRAQLTRLVKVCLLKKIGGAGVVDTSTCFPQQRKQSSWTMPSLHV